jgi:hypothetical protein
MKKFDNSIVNLDLRPIGLDQYSPGDKQTSPPPDDDPMDVVTHFIMDPEAVHTKDNYHFLDGTPRSLSYPISG